MGTTDAAVAARSLDALTAAHVRFAVMHGEKELAGGRTPSDIDIVVDRHPRLVLEAVLTIWRSVGLAPIALNPYDVGGSAAIFLFDPRLESGAQLDLFFDPHGHGRLGIHTGELLRNAELGTRFPAIGPLHRSLYLLRKRSWKRDSTAMAELRRQVSQFTKEEFEREARRTLRPSVYRDIAHYLKDEGGHSFTPPPGYRGRNAFRIVWRLARPVGFWVHFFGVQAEAHAVASAERLGRVLVTAEHSQLPVHIARRATWLIEDVAPTILRPGLFASWSSERNPPRGAHLALRADTEDPTLGRFKLVNAMSRRLIT